jgi:hypothetical protein
MQQSESVLEQIKFIADYLKHVATLSTGSLVLLTVFLEKLFNKPRWRPLVTIALASFTVSLVSSVIAFEGLLQPLPALEGNIDTGSRLWQIGGFGTSAGFITGVVSLAVFAIRNWHAS